MKSDKLLESTQSILQGKLIESWIKNSDFIKSIELTFGKDSIVKSGNYWCTIIYQDLYFTITCDYKKDLLKTKEMDVNKVYQQPIKGDIFSTMELNKKNLDNILNLDQFVIIIKGTLKYSEKEVEGYYTGEKEVEKLVTTELNESRVYNTRSQAQDDCKYIKEFYNIDFKELNLAIEEI